MTYVPDSKDVTLMLKALLIIPEMPVTSLIEGLTNEPSFGNLPASVSLSENFRLKALSVDPADSI